MDETYSSQPLAQNGKKVRRGKGSQTWNEKNPKEKKKDPPISKLTIDENINL
jgi:hypothetical protein